MPLQRASIFRLIAYTTALLVGADVANAADPLAKKAVDAALDAAYANYARLTVGKNADYSLDAAGNSVRALKAIADISNALNGNPYATTAK